MVGRCFAVAFAGIGALGSAWAAEPIDTGLYDAEIGFDDYDKLLQELESKATIEPWPDPGKGGSASFPQLWEGTSAVITREPGKDGKDDDKVELDRGKVFTRFVDGEGWVESWVVREPDDVMRRSQRLPHLGAGSLAASLPAFQDLPDAEEYGILTFKFRYLCPPSPESVAMLPSRVPAFVTDVLRFRVFFTEDGVEQEAGALYRERIVVPPGASAPEGVQWQDTWTLWDNFDLPNPEPVMSPAREVRLEATPWGGEAVRGFLEEQLTALPGRCVVRTRSDVTPVR